MRMLPSSAFADACLAQFKRSEMLKQPWQRQITGPSYDFGDEFSTAIQDAVNRREARWARLHPDELPIRSEYRVLFEEMILESLSQEYAEGKGRPTIRVYPPEDAPPEAMSCPPFDFIYTNRYAPPSILAARTAPDYYFTQQRRVR